MARTILVVEDEPTLRETLAEALETDGFRVISAADGREALTVFRAERPDLVLLDLMLPELSGVEVCRRIKAQRPEQKVLICSAAIMPDAERALIEMGVCDHLMKPYHPDVLLAYIARMLRPSPPLRLAPLPSSVRLAH